MLARGQEMSKLVFPAAFKARLKVFRGLRRSVQSPWTVSGSKTGRHTPANPLEEVTVTNIIVYNEFWKRKLTRGIDI